MEKEKGKNNDIKKVVSKVLQENDKSNNNDLEKEILKAQELVKEATEEAEKLEITRPLNKHEKRIIAETTASLFAVHYIDIGYNFREEDLAYFNLYVSQEQEKKKHELPQALELNYCLRIVQDIIEIVRLLRYEQRIVENFITTTHLKLYEFCYTPNTINIATKEALLKKALTTIELLAEARAMIQYLTIVFEILNIDNYKYKDVVNKTSKVYEKYYNYTLVEFLNDSTFWDSVNEKLAELKIFLFEDNNKNFNKIVSKFTRSETDISLKQCLQAIKYLNEQDVIDECYGIQKELAEHNDHQAKKYFETYLLNIKDGTYNENFRKASLRYLDIKNFYKSMFLLKGAEFENEKK